MAYSATKGKEDDHGTHSATGRICGEPPGMQRWAALTSLSADSKPATTLHLHSTNIDAAA
jgi:hypothetical protein